MVQNATSPRLQSPIAKAWEAMLREPQMMPSDVNLNSQVNWFEVMPNRWQHRRGWVRTASLLSRKVTQGRSCMIEIACSEEDSERRFGTQSNSFSRRPQGTQHNKVGGAVEDERLSATHELQDRGNLHPLDFRKRRASGTEWHSIALEPAPRVKSCKGWHGEAELCQLPFWH